MMPSLQKIFSVTADECSWNFQYTEVQLWFEVMWSVSAVLNRTGLPWHIYTRKPICMCGISRTDHPGRMSRIMRYWFITGYGRVCSHFHTAVEILFHQWAITLPPLYLEIHEQRVISNFCCSFPNCLEKGVREVSACSTLPWSALPPPLERGGGSGYSSNARY